MEAIRRPPRPLLALRKVFIRCCEKNCRGNWGWYLVAKKCVFSMHGSLAIVASISAHTEPLGGQWTQFRGPSGSGDHSLYALDSTTIDLCLSLFPYFSPRRRRLFVASSRTRSPLASRMTPAPRRYCRAYAKVFIPRKHSSTGYVPVTSMHSIAK